jgi:hypothetical protein
VERRAKRVAVQGRVDIPDERRTNRGYCLFREGSRPPARIMRHHHRGTKVYNGHVRVKGASVCDDDAAIHLDVLGRLARVIDALSESLRRG